MNSSAPLKVDDSEDYVLDSFCDVRFDRQKRSDILGGAPRKVYCTATGKVFCHECAAFNHKMPHLSSDPDKPAELVVCHEVHLQALRAGQKGEAAAGRVQYVTERTSVPKAAPPKKVVLATAAAAPDDDDANEEGTLVDGIFRRVPLVGGSLADTLASALPGLP